MNDTYFMGYKFNRNIKHFTPSTVICSNGTDNITVAMANEVLDYILGIIARKNPLTESYLKAKKVLSALKMIFDNKQPSRFGNEYIKAAVDVLEEIGDQTAKSPEKKEYNAKCAMLCRLIIDGFTGGMS